MDSDDVQIEYNICSKVLEEYFKIVSALFNVMSQVAQFAELCDYD